MRALLCGVYFRAPDAWKLPQQENQSSTRYREPDAACEGCQRNQSLNSAAARGTGGETNSLRELFGNRGDDHLSFEVSVKLLTWTSA